MKVADLPSECWQSDFTHYPLAGGADTEVLTWLDDHSRYALSVTAHVRVTGPAGSPPSAPPRTATGRRHRHSRTFKMGGVPGCRALSGRWCEASW
jgi:hypothetical protein